MKTTRPLLALVLAALQPITASAAALQTVKMSGLPGAGPGGRSFNSAALSLPAAHAGLTVAGPGLLAPAPLAAPAPQVAYAELTGALTRSSEDPGLVKKMWFVYGSAEELQAAADAIERVKDMNPGVDIVYYHDKAVLTDDSVEGRKALFERILKEDAGFVLASSQEIYESFRGLRDLNLARQIPMGYAGRRHVSVDMPRPSLNPAILSDPRLFPHRKYLVMTEHGASKVAAPIANMTGIRATLDEVLSSEAVGGHSSKKGDEDMGLLARLGTKLMMRMAKQADDKRTSKRRQKAHRMAAYLEREAVDVLAIDSAETAAIVALMKEMGYHKSLPVIWTSRQDPGDASGLNLALHAGTWMEKAPHVTAAATASLGDAVAQAPSLLRLPDNFMDMGGVSVLDFERRTAEAVEKAIPPSPGSGKKFDIHFLMTNGNGVKAKGDANAFGHFGMAVTDEQGKIQVWTVQYNDGGSFTGGLGDGKQLTLAEYLYTLWYLPGAVGQAIPLAETAVSPVFDFVLRGMGEAGLESMRRKAAEINARHLKGQDNYSFLNKGGMTNCISLVTQILRAAGFPIAETGVQDPAGQAVNMIGLFARQMMTASLNPDDIGFLVFERPKHAGPEHYRVTNTALASPLFNRVKPWKKMTWREKVMRALSFPLNLWRAMRVPSELEAFSRMASHRLAVGPNSRELELKENPDSPILRLRQAQRTVARLQSERVALMESLQALEEGILKAIGLEGWQLNPGQTLAQQAERRKKALGAEAQAKLEEELARHHELDVALALSNLDEQIELRRLEFLKVVLVDPTDYYAGRLKPVRAAYAKVQAYRDAILTENRLLTEQEIDELDDLNALVETSLSKLQLEILKGAGPIVPRSMKMILGQLSSETLEDLSQASQGPTGSKKTPN